MSGLFDFIDTTEFKKFLAENAEVNPLKLRLKQFPNLPFNKDLAIIQIECRNRAKKKIPELAEKIAYPTNVCIEQCTSEVLARFHASLFEGIHTAYDMTCGLGIDTYYISRVAKRVFSVDAAETVAAAAKRNMEALGAANVAIAHSTAEDFLKGNELEMDSAIFVDPSRRLTADRNVRTYAIRDTVPDVGTIIKSAESRCKFIIVKASPMCDISQTIADFDNISDIWVLSVRNECKEVLFKIDFKNASESPRIHCIDFTANGVDNFSFQKKVVAVSDGNPKAGNRLLVPNASVMKAGAYDIVADQFSLKRIAANSHLHLSDGAVEGYPGRQFHIVDVLTLSRADVKKLKGLATSANIACRNFPMKPEELRKRLKMADGGNFYIFATTLADNTKCLICCEGVNA